jgi:hypothetical protein
MTSFYKTISRLLVALVFLTSTPTLFAATFPVINTNDAGAGSLRDAVTAASINPGADDIVFSIPGIGPFTINLLSSLPVIVNGPLFINGFSQPGSVAGPIATRTILIQINGAGLPGTNPFVLATGDVTIAGLAIYNCPHYAINLSSNLNNVHIWGNYIGTDATGNTPGLGNQGGILSNFGSSHPNINFNIIVGTNGDGTADANEGNLIVGSGAAGPINGWGVVFWLTRNSTVAGNIIGLDKDGNALAGMGNARDGVLATVLASANVFGTDGDGTSDALEGNLICSNAGFGILLAGASDNSIVAGNQIGLDALNVAAGNLFYGVGILNSSGIRIGTDGNGTSDAFETNIISSNLSGGIGINALNFFTNANADNNTVAGNIIGTDATLTLIRGNTGAGILLRAETAGLNVDNNIIGSNYDGNGDADEGNIITNNDTGIHIVPPIAGSTTTGNKISRNSIFGNDQLGIDLGGDGITVNDNGDADTGPNDLFNAPVLISTQIQGANLVVTGFSVPGSVVEFYVGDGGTNPDPLPGGVTKSFGEGQIFLFRGQDDATLDGVTDADLTTGNYDGSAEGTGAGGTRTENRFMFSVPIVSLPFAVTSGTRITALAYANTTGAGSTSEFGGTISASALPVSLTSFRGRLDGNKAELTWTTAEEVDNSHFEIERSANGQAYTKIGSVKGNGGTNNSYHFTDNGPLGSINYYRLKQVDIDGDATYTRALVLRSDLVIAAKAAPSPFTSFINLSYKLQKEENIRIRLIDPVGRIVKTYSTRGGAGVNTINLNGLDNLPKGSYTVELTGETVSFRQQVLKQ